MEKAINVNSEIGKLKSVLLHRPGAEVENITPDTMHQLLFDDIPYLKIAQKEHDFFLLKHYVIMGQKQSSHIEDLATDVFQTESVKKISWPVSYMKLDIVQGVHLKV